jgi:hypothetical protein
MGVGTGCGAGCGTGISVARAWFAQSITIAVARTHRVNIDDFLIPRNGHETEDDRSSSLVQVPGDAEYVHLSKRVIPIIA